MIDNLHLPIIAVGASAGGLEALTTMFANVANTVNVAFVVIQHLDPDHESVMADILGRKTALAVRQASDEDIIERGTIYLIPPGKVLRIHAGRLYLTSFSEPRGARRPIDDFFLSLAEEAYTKTAAVVLSGTGADGAYGLRAVKESGGLIVVQSPEEAKYDGMPLSAINTGMVDHIVSAADIVTVIVNVFEAQQLQEHPEIGQNLLVRLPEICQLLRARMGHDFSGYKHPTLIRRLERRMYGLGITDVSAYMALLRSSHDECTGLFNDFLINITRFFRDPANFEVLARRAIDPIIASCGSGDPVRIWVPACSSGEEAYSIAMACFSAADRYGVQPNIQIFATDIDPDALDTARNARYSIDALKDIPEELRANYVTVQGKKIQIVPRVRDVVRFSVHNLVRDPAFSRMDLISCRNLFIYFNDKTQRSIVPLLHFSLKAAGYLFLGPSESIGENEHLFSSIDRQARLYRKRDVPGSYPLEIVSNGMPMQSLVTPKRDTSAPLSQPPMDVSVRHMLDHYAPTSVTISDRGEIVNSTGRLARYFEFNGRGQESAISSARKGLRDVLGPLQRKAEQARARVMRRDVEVTSEFGMQKVDVIADPLSDGYMMIVFKPVEDFDTSIQEIETDDLEGGGRIAVLEEELHETRLRLRVTIEELETANEELKSSNEEMMSMNEELQSTNEELTTANDELKHKIDQLDTLNSDQRNFFVSTDLAVVILDAQMRVRTYTPRVREIFPLRDSDKGRYLSEIATNLENDTFLATAVNVQTTGTREERLVHASGRSYQMRIMPYISSGGRIDGVTLTFVDVTELHDIQSWLTQERQSIVQALHTGNTGIFDFDTVTERFTMDEQMARLFDIKDDESRTMSLDEFLRYILPEDHVYLRQTLRTDGSNLQIKFDITVRAMVREELRYLRVLGGDVTGARDGLHLIGLCQDTTSQREQDNTQRLMIAEMNHRIKNLFAIVGSLIRLSERDAKDVASFSQSARSRISALSRAHIATQGDSFANEVNLQQLIKAALEPYDPEQITILGPNLELPSVSANPLSLILHEWATNAAKYGALTQPMGSVSVRWNLSDNGTVTLEWKEKLQHILNLDKGERNIGFGTTLVELSARQLGGKVTAALEATGFSATLEFSMSRHRG